MREPAFWWRKPGIAARALAPLAVGLRPADRRAAQARRTAGGGAGGLHRQSDRRRRRQDADRDRGRGLAGASRGAADVSDPRLWRARSGPAAGRSERHRATDVGDEPLLLARAAPTIVARARVAGAAAAVDAGASVIVMDDGFQNPALAKDFSLLVVDSGRGIGNGLVTPAGPLRAPLGAQLEHAHAVLVIGPAAAAANVVAQRAARTASRCFTHGSSRMPASSRRMAAAACWRSPASATRRSSLRHCVPPASRSRRRAAFRITTAIRVPKPTVCADRQSATAWCW